MEELIEDYTKSEFFGIKYVHYYVDGKYVDHGRWIYTRTPIPGDVIHPPGRMYGQTARVVSIEDTDELVVKIHVDFEPVQTVVQKVEPDVPTRKSNIDDAARAIISVPPTSDAIQSWEQFVADGYGSVYEVGPLSIRYEENR